jgi:multisubunit Na+/H+ antiporter MnhG subunit
VIFCFALSLALGLATGKRTTILGPVMTLAMCYIIPAITENKRLFTTRNSIILFVAMYLMTGPVADMAMAMAIGRDNHRQTSASMTFDNIMKIYQDKELLHSLYQLSVMRGDNMGNNMHGWSEYYVDNIVLDRFCNIRVCDATLFYADKLGFDNPKMHEYMANQILFLFPTPILHALNIYVNKFELQYTPGDLLSTEGLRLKEQYHGYRVAGDTGIGLYLWGYKYYIFAFFLYYALFYFLSSKVLVTHEGKALIPVMEILVLFRTFLMFNNDTGIVGVVSTLLRTGWQAIVLYCLIFYVVRIFIK